jgi:Ca2+-binding EF-hand superfamily protein
MTKLISVLAGMALAGGAAWAMAQDSPAGEKGGRRGPGRSATELLEKYDANKDGQLDREELAAVDRDREGRREQMKARMLERFDANKNGVLDPEEKQAAGKKFRGRRGGRGHGRMLERFDANKNGVLDPEEKDAAKAALAQRRAEFLKRFDTNGDGKLDDAEREAARKEFPRGRDRRDPQQ